MRTEGAINNFPCGREYRLILWRGEVVNCTYYWGTEDPFGAVELAPLYELAKEAQERLAVPFLAVDLGQLEDDSWKLIEVGDPQFSLYSFMLYPEFWQKLGQKR